MGDSAAFGRLLGGIVQLLRAGAPALGDARDTLLQDFLAREARCERSRRATALSAAEQERQRMRGMVEADIATFFDFDHGVERRAEGVRAVVLLDRGFERVLLIEHLRRFGLASVIRSGGNVQALHAQYQGPLQGLITTRGEKRFLRNVVLRPSRPVQVRVVGKWERGQQEMRQHRAKEARAQRLHTGALLRDLNEMEALRAPSEILWRGDRVVLRMTRKEAASTPAAA